MSVSVGSVFLDFNLNVDDLDRNLARAKRLVGVNRRFVQPGATYGYKPYTATVTGIDTRFNRTHE
ncbi:hypothetical protein [Mastigocladopsis repens]|uniref:hypothetical protein n=1 Tax=Mastigocladopsis repens TaxID=221287 RepID=UPI0012EA1A1A|nr:hypothetical protein [Mastigocladopsis repens]